MIVLCIWVLLSQPLENFHCSIYLVMLGKILQQVGHCTTIHVRKARLNNRNGWLILFQSQNFGHKVLNCQFLRHAANLDDLHRNACFENSHIKKPCTRQMQLLNPTTLNWMLVWKFRCKSIKDDEHYIKPYRWHCWFHKGVWTNYMIQSIWFPAHGAKIGIGKWVLLCHHNLCSAAVCHILRAQTENKSPDWKLLQGGS